MSAERRSPESRPRRTATAAPSARSRRRIAALIAIGGAALLAFALFALRRGGAQADLRSVPHQNVLLITIDTLRADALGAYGGRAATPALDRLARDGVRFDFAHAHAVLTLPSHASILTGVYPYQHGIRDNAGYRLAPRARTIATLLTRAGYRTAAFVGAFPLHSRFGLNQGFDVYDDRFGETRAPTEFVMPERPATAVVALARDWIAKQTGHDGRLTTSDRPGTRDRLSTRGSELSTRDSRLSSGLSTNDSRLATDPSWFLWVHVFDPHAPYRPPPPFDAQYARPYDGEVAATDAALAPLIDDVRASPAPTIVIVTGDHGEALGDHGEQTHGLFAYESTLRVPLIIAELGGTVRLKADTTTSAIRLKADTTTAREAAAVDATSEQGQGLLRRATSYVVSGFSRTVTAEVSHVAARHVDILPTLLDAVGLPIPADLPGRTLLPAAERRGGAPRSSYFESMTTMLNRGWAPLTGVLADRDKYIDLPIMERYDLAADAAEATNLAGRSPERDRALAAALRSFNAPLPGRREIEDADATARLRSLGYVTGSAPIKSRYTEADDPKTLVAVDQELHRAVDLYVSKRYDEAVRAYREILARRPDMAIAYRHLAFVAWETGQTRAAIDVLQRAVASGVTSGGIVTQLGTYLAEGGNAAAAVRLLEPLAGAASPDLDALNGLGIAYARAGQAEAARRTFERMLSLDPQSAMALANLGALDLERSDLTSARAQFSRAVRADPTSSAAHAGLGVVAIKSGDRDAAVAEWRKAYELDATNYDALYNLATTLARGGQHAAARPYLEQFARSAPPAFYAKDIREVTALLKSPN